MTTVVFLCIGARFKIFRSSQGGKYFIFPLRFTVFQEDIIWYYYTNCDRDNKMCPSYVIVVCVSVRWALWRHGALGGHCLTLKSVSSDKIRGWLRAGDRSSTCSGLSSALMSAVKWPVCQDFCPHISPFAWQDESSASKGPIIPVITSRYLNISTLWP